MATNLVEFSKEISEKYNDSPAILFKPGFKYVSWSYKELSDDSIKAAGYFQSMGLAKGDRVLIWGPNSPMWVIAFFACAKAGIILVPLDIKSPPEFVATVKDRTKPKLALVSRSTPSDCESIGVPLIYMEDLPNLYEQCSSYDEVDVTENDLVEIMFTSGTTGDPKGVMLTHKNLISNLNSVNKVIKGKQSDRLLSVLPLSHMFEQMGGMLFPLNIGANITYVTSRRPKSIFKTMQDRKVTVMLLVPQALDLFKKGIEREIDRQGKTKVFQKLMNIAKNKPKFIKKLIFRRLRQQMGGSMRLIFAGGAPLQEPVGQWWQTLGIDVIQGYGATEASPVIACHPESDPRYDCPGPPLPGVEIKIADDGEVLVTGDNITSGYWENEEKTREAFEGKWYKTGDQGLIDNDGFLRLNGRKKDMIVLSNGQNVFPEDIEAVLIEHDSVIDAAVVGMNSDDGMEVHAALLLNDEKYATTSINWANSRLASHQKIRNHTVWQSEDFPRTHTLKVKKPLVIEAILNGSAIKNTKKELVDTENEDPLLKLVSELSGIPTNQIPIDGELESEMGLDSLGRVELLSAIEEDMEIFIDDGDISGETTIADLQFILATTDKSPKQRSPINWGLNLWAKLIRGFIQNIFIFPILSISYKIEVKGYNNLSSIKGPSLLIGNHVLNMDHAIYIKTLPPNIRKNLAVAAGAHMYNNFIRGFIITLLGNAFPFATAKSEKSHNKGNVRDSLENMGAIMDKGWSVLIFPEGELTVGGPMKPFLSGTGLMAIAGNLPVIPMNIHVDNLGYPSYIPIFKRGKILVTFGTPITPPWDGTPDQITSFLEKSVSELDS